MNSPSFQRVASPRIKITEVIPPASQKEKDPLQGARIIDDSGSEYILQSPPFDDARIRHTTLTKSYFAIRERSPEPRNAFVLKVPDPQGLKDPEIKERIIEDVRKLFEQERELWGRLPESSRAVLPSFFIAEQNEQPEIPTVLYKGDEIPYLACEFIKGVSLREWTRDHAPRGVSDLKDWFDLAKAVVRALAKLHKERVTHGFISPDSVILLQSGLDARRFDIKFINAAGSQPKVYLRTKDAKGGSVPGLGDERVWKTLPLRRWYDVTDNLYFCQDPGEKWATFELHQGSDYYSVTDIFSLGVTLAFLATGKDEDVVPVFDHTQTLQCGHRGWQVVKGCRTKTEYHRIKVQLLDTLKEAAEKRSSDSNTLINAAENRSSDKEAERRKTIYIDALSRTEVILQCLRSDPQQAQSVSHLETLLEAFQPSQDANGEHYRSSASEFVRSLKTVTDKSEGSVRKYLTMQAVRQILEEVPWPVCTLAHHRLRRAVDAIHDLSSGRTSSIRVEGSQTSIIDAFLIALWTLSEEQDPSKHEIVALTGAALWNKDNFGVTSPTSTMLQLLRLRGVAFQWVIVVRVSEFYMPDVQLMLSFRREDDRSIQKLTEQDKRSEETQGGKGPNGYFYVCKTDEEYDDIFRDRKSFIGIRKRDANELTLHIAPDLSSRSGPLAALTFWVHPVRDEKLLKAFDDIRNVARPVVHGARLV